MGGAQRAAGALEVYFETFQALVNNSGTRTRDLFNVYQGQLKGSLFTTAHVNHSIGVDLAYNDVILRPRVSSDPLLNSVDFVRDRAGTVEAYYSSNSHNSRYYPTKGSVAKLSLGYTFGGNTKLRLDADSIKYTHKINVANILQAHAVYNKLIPLDKRFTLSATAGMLLSLLNDDIGFSTLGHYYFGGFKPRIVNSYSFYGAQNYDYSTSSHLLGKLDLQWRAYRHLFVTAGVNYLNIKYPMDWIFSNYHQYSDLGHDYSWRLGYGISVGYLSIVGPISISAAMDSKHQKLITNFSLGFYL